MASEALISWNAPAHIYVEKKPDWYWAVGIITLALAVTAFLFGAFINGLFIIVAALALVIHASRPPHIVKYEINDRGLVADDTLYPFVTLDSFWIPHDEFPAKILIKSRKLLMPYIVIYIEGVDPENVRQILLTYIAATEHHEPLIQRVHEWLGF
ncbi:MAG TPA: hypothetical protein VF438_01825 [Candidatus Paceibacterota bacterium]